MTNKVTAEAPANLAFVKYWGKKDAKLRIPTNNSISVNLSEAKTITTVDFDLDYTEDQIITPESQSPPKAEFVRRVVEHLGRVRTLASTNLKAIVTTKNTFPSGVGIASSASGFAALSLAASAALGLNLSSSELSRLARLGSGSACRSIPDGFSEWRAGDSDETSYAVQVAPADHWDIRIVTVAVSRKEKKLSSTDGHSLALTSPFFEARLGTIPQRLDTVRRAILEREFDLLGREVEMEAISFHTIAMTAPIPSEEGWLSGAYYWLPDSLEIMLAVQEWRNAGLEVYFTLDAGPTVHLLCVQRNVEQVITSVRELERSKADRTWDIFVNAPSMGAKVVG